MNNLTPTLPVIRLAGLHLDTLGHYFAALGVLRLSARKWPTVKGCWRGGVFCLVGGAQNFAELKTFLLGIGVNGQWTPYAINRPENAPTDSQEKKGRDTSLWIARTNEAEAVLGLSHVVGGNKRDFNLVFGTGGNAGARNFRSGWSKAADSIDNTSKFSKSLSGEIKKKQEQAGKALAAIKKEGTKKHTEAIKKKEFAEQLKILLEAPQHHLAAFLAGKPCAINPSVRFPKNGNTKNKETIHFLTDYGAASWFSAANKIYNFSPDKPFRDGQITPWAMLFACEAFPLLVGATSRRIGSKRQGTGAFPFVTQGVAPENEKETGTVEGEFWAPVWSQPLSLPEVSTLFNRGRAEVNGRGAITSAAFASAIIQKGTDAGLSEFRRFSLLHTTSAQTFESRLASVHPLNRAADTAQAKAVSRIIRFRELLPRDKQGNSWRYRGLQGPVDNALVRLAAAGKDDELRVESSWQLLDAVFFSLEKTANNKTYREREPALELLPLSWVISLLENTHEITIELKIALALATLKPETAFKTSGEENKNDQSAPLIAYRVGVVPAWINNWRTIKIAKNTPLRVVWSQRDLADNLFAILHRRIAVESDANAEPPCNAQLSLSIADVLSFLNKETDDALIVRWLNRFMLFDWHFIEKEERKQLSSILRDSYPAAPLLAEEMLYAFLRPLFHTYTFERLDSKNNSESRIIPTANALRPLVALLERGNSAAAYRAAVNRYKSLLQTTAFFGENAFAIPEPRRLLATLLLPTNSASIVNAFTRWTIPVNKQQAR